MLRGQVNIKRVAVASIIGSLFVVPLVLAIKFQDAVSAVALPRSYHETQISEALEPIATKRLRVDCSLNDGETTPGTQTLGKNIYVKGIGSLPVIFLTEEICTKVLEYRDSPDKAWFTAEHAQALLTATHEAVHTRNVKDEAVTDCYAMQLVDQTAMQLGATEKQAEFMQKIAISLQKSTSEPEYITSDCRNNGPLDLDPGKPGLFPY